MVGHKFPYIEKCIMYQQSVNQQFPDTWIGRPSLDCGMAFQISKSFHSRFLSLMVFEGHNVSSKNKLSQGIYYQSHYKHN